MPITHKKGNAVDALINGEVDVLLHCCNARGVMGAGIALEIKNRIPDAYEVYKHNHELGSITIGEYLRNDNRCGYVVNMVAQAGYGITNVRYVDYGMLAKCLNQVEVFSCCTNNKIGIPYKLASDRAGGDWQIVLELVEGILGDKFDITVYEL